MAKVYDEDGNELGDYLSPEEVEAEAAKKAEELLTQKKAEIEAEAVKGKDEELAKAKQELEKLQKQERNFEKLRKIAEDKEGKEDEYKTTLTKLQEEINAIKQKPFEDLKGTFVEKNIGADQELKDKFDHYYKKLSDGATSEAEVNAALRAAYSAATDGTKQPDMGGGVVNTKPGIPSGGAGSGNQPSEASQGFAKAFGLKDADKEKYGKDDKVNLF